MPGRYGFWLHEYQRGFPVLPNHVQADPKQSISVVQFWPRNVAFEPGQLLAQGRILEGDLFLTAENEKNETNRNHNRVQHGDTSLRSSVRRIKRLRCENVLANHSHCCRVRLDASSSSDSEWADAGSQPSFFRSHHRWFVHPLHAAGACFAVGDSFKDFDSAAFSQNPGEAEVPAAVFTETSAATGSEGPTKQLIDAVVEMKRRNPTWGCKRIAQQIILGFGVGIDKDVVRRILSTHFHPEAGSGGPSWLSFIGHAKDSLWSLVVSMRVRDVTNALGFGGDGSIYASDRRLCCTARRCRWSPLMPDVQPCDSHAEIAEVSNLGS
jgi:hypothetical protein